MQPTRDRTFAVDEGAPTAETGSFAVVTPNDLCLQVLSGPDTGASLALHQGRYLVGKNRDCALVLRDGAVSRHHLELLVDDVGVMIRDLGSTNGSFYHGARFTQMLVGPGAVITVGATQLKLVRRSPRLEPSESDHFGRLFGRSLVMRQLFAVLERVAPSNAPVLIEGETGTGKELCAEALHQHSRRANGPFVVCDLAGVPRTLIESELFGHVKGSFTGASSDHVGAFEAAHEGTVFLDEIGELELDFQPRLLRALENKSIRRVGSIGYRAVDVRIIAATNRDLSAEMNAGAFRGDLFHRLAVVRVRVPALRERKEDLPFLIEQLLGGSGVTASPSTLALLQEHDWPGNVRELKNVIERGLALTPPGGVLEPPSLGLSIGDGPELHAADSYHEAKQKLIDAWERGYVRRVLDETGGNVSQAARRCGLGRAYLHRLIRKYQLD